LFSLEEVSPVLQNVAKPKTGYMIMISQAINVENIVDFAPISNVLSFLGNQTDFEVPTCTCRTTAVNLYHHNTEIQTKHFIDFMMNSSFLEITIINRYSPRVTICVFKTRFTIHFILSFNI